MSADDVKNRVLRFSVYDVDKRKVRHSLGHVMVPLRDADLGHVDTYWSDLEPMSQVCITLAVLTRLSGCLSACVCLGVCVGSVSLCLCGCLLACVCVGVCQHVSVWVSVWGLSACVWVGVCQHVSLWVSL